MISSFISKLLRPLSFANKKGNYLIEFRFYGKTKKYSRDLSRLISKRFRVRQVSKRGKPPHVTLYGGFSTSNEQEMLNRFTKICKKSDLISYQLDGFDHIEKNVIHLNIKPSSELIQLRKELAKELNEICQGKEWDDPNKEFIFHNTLAFRDIEAKFDDIWHYLQSLKIPKLDRYLLRITLLKNRRIFREYDLIQRQMLHRNEALSWRTLQKTIRILKEMKTNGGKRTEIHWNEKASSKKKIFFISDLHLDHANIIKYTNRPFHNVEEMNEALVDNCNNIVRKQDTVYFLGDLTFGKRRRPVDYWLKQLNGKIIFLEGNHEEATSLKNYYSKEKNVFLRYGSKEFLLVHDPALKPSDWNGWTIHGHKHNNHPKDFPFIHKKNKTINVSAELVDYTPLNIEKIIKEIE